MTDPKIGSTLLLNGAEVVLAVAGGEPGDAGNRKYQTWVRGPWTNHTNAEMVQLLAMLAASIVIGNAQGGRISVQQSMDECVHIFKASLDAHVHQVIASGAATQGMTTIPMSRDKPSS